jgi:hypothetical protein
MAIPRYRYNQKRKRRGGKFQRGFYTPINEDKYRQPHDKLMNSQPLPEYRSSWEKKFMMYLDSSPTIEWWSTESIAIPYISPLDNQTHRYYCDFFFLTTAGVKNLVEIKPKNQCNNPVNIAKWESAKRYCDKIGAVFSVVTEVELKKWGLIK